MSPEKYFQGIGDRPLWSVCCSLSRKQFPEHKALSVPVGCPPPPASGVCVFRARLQRWLWVCGKAKISARGNPWSHYPTTESWDQWGGPQRPPPLQTTTCGHSSDSDTMWPPAGSGATGTSWFPRFLITWGSLYHKATVFLFKLNLLPFFFNLTVLCLAGLLQKVLFLVKELKLNVGQFSRHWLRSIE